jgi:hypothetical protein
MNRKRQRSASFDGDRSLKGDHVSACLIETGEPCVRLILGRTLLKPGEILKTADIKGSKGICIASVDMKPRECALNTTSTICWFLLCFMTTVSYSIHAANPAKLVISFVNF